MTEPASATGKALLVYVAGPQAGESYLLTDAVADDCMGIRCISGTYQSTSSKHWLGSRPMHIPLEKVLYFIEFESHEAFKDAVKRHYEEKAK